jgi:hypothetical protein
MPINELSDNVLATSINNYSNSGQLSLQFTYLAHGSMPRRAITKAIVFALIQNENNTNCMHKN